MFSLICLLFFFSGPSSYSPDIEKHKLELTPLDFSDESNPKTFFSGIGQIEGDEDTLYVADTSSAWILMIDKDGNYKGSLGQAGEGPKEWGRGPRAFAVEQGHLWAADYQNDALHLFVDGAHQLRLPIERPIQTPGSNNFVFSLSDAQLLYQAHPGKGSLAALYDFDGNLIKYVGELPKLDIETQRANPFMHQTLWQQQGDHYYALFKFMPIMIKFDQEFNELDRFYLDSPEINELQDQFEDHKKTNTNKPGKGRSYRISPTMFSDFKTHKDLLYVMCRGVLYQINPKDGQMMTRVDFSIPTRDSIKPTFFTFLKDDVMVVGHSNMLWDHDLWKIEKPPFL